MTRRIRILLTLLAVLSASALHAQSYVAHNPTGQVYNEPTGVTERNAAIPREDEAVDLWCSVGYQFQYTSVAVYYTTDGTAPAGNIGFPSGTTQVLTSFASQVQFKYNQSTGGGVVDWWKATLPSNTRTYGKTIKYFFQAWGATTSAQSPVFTYTVKLAWPGQGSAFANHTIGYPPYHMWKEEAVTGNNYMNVMLDQNGSLYDVYYPSAGTVEGVSAKNEGYVDGVDTFPPGLPLGSRGQLNLNCAFGGLRVDGKTYWMTNSTGGDYTSLTQKYLNDETQTVQTTATLVASGNNIKVEQIDFSPKGITYPTDAATNPLRGMSVKRVILTNLGPASKEVNYYFYGDFALNGGDAYDTMFTDAARGAMVARDNTFRLTSSSGEYNPSTFSAYTKNASLVLAAAMKVVPTVGGSGGTAASEFWRDTSADDNQGWIGTKLTLAPGQSKEINIIVAGGFDNFAGATGTYSYQVAPVLDWFLANNMSSVQGTTDTYWSNWLTSGTLVDTPDDNYDRWMKRGLLGTALHLDGKYGAVVAGMHNGAYMYCWPRDAVWAAVTLDRTGHHPEASEIYRWLKDVAFRAFDGPRKSFWYQKYTMDGYQIWTAPQVDETAVVPWGVKYHYDATGDSTWLLNQYEMVKDAALASSQDCGIDSRMRYEESVKLMYSMSLWEDAFDTFIYSNVNVIRGLWDAAAIANMFGNTSDANLFNSRAADIKIGVDARLDWNGENTDISQLGAVYPFRVYSPVDLRVKKVVDRMNGVATDRYGNVHPIVNTSGEHQDLINRYYGDTYWNGGPWTLSTLWYGMYYLNRADYTRGKADIDNAKLRMDKVRAAAGPVGLGAEQIAGSNSLLYSGQTDFRHQAAWPNAWESMSFITDAIMGFLDFVPDAATNTLRISPKLPTGWSLVTYKNVEMNGHSFDITLSEQSFKLVQQIKNKTGNFANLGTWQRIPVGYSVAAVRKNNVAVPYTYDSAGHRVNVQTSLSTGVNALTTIEFTLQKLQDGPGLEIPPTRVRR